MPVGEDGYTFGPGVERPDFLIREDLDLPQVDTVSITSLVPVEEGYPANSREAIIIYPVYELTPDDNMPRSVAEWLRYRTYSEHVVRAENEGDLVRFKNVEEIMESFLGDKTGRTLYIAIHPTEGSLDGAAWTHSLAAEPLDFLLLDSARTGLGDQEVQAEDLATFASREYGVAIHKNMSLCMGAAAVSKYFNDYPEYRGTVGRYGSADSTAREFHDAVNQITDLQNIKVIDAGPGWNILMAVRGQEELFDRGWRPKDLIEG